MYRILFALIFLLSACTKHETVKPLAPKALELKSIDDRCLDLQSLASQFNDPSLSLQGMINTKNFEITSGADARGANTVVLRSLRIRPAQGLHLGELRGLQQSDCETISIPDPIGKPIKYKITKFSKDHLAFELKSDSLKEAAAEVPAAIASGFKKFPAVKKIEVWVPNNSRMDLSTEYTSVPGDCPNAPSFEVKEELTYRWSDTSPSQVRFDRSYFDRLKELSSVPAVVSGFGLNFSNSGEVAMSVGDALELQKQLQANTNVTCN